MLSLWFVTYIEIIKQIYSGSTLICFSKLDKQKHAYFHIGGKHINCIRNRIKSFMINSLKETQNHNNPTRTIKQ